MACDTCGQVMAFGPLRFVGLWGQIRQLDTVLHAWDGEPQPLAMLLPERPRFVTDLTPPQAREGDADALALLLGAVAAGRYGEALAMPALEGGSRAHVALAIAHERQGSSARAVNEWTLALEAGESSQARMARGAWFAKAGLWDAADADMALAGTTPEAGWNRAALAVHREIARTPGLPGKSAIAAARAQAGVPSPRSSHNTVGRLVWSLVAERVLARREVGEMMDFDLSQLREAEDLFEFATFWDRAMVLVTYSRLELTGDVGRVALPLAREVAAALLAEPPMHGAALAEFAAAVSAAYDAASQRLPRPAWRALYPWMRDDRLKRYRMPCVACGKGWVGIEPFARNGADGESLED